MALAGGRIRGGTVDRRDRSRGRPRSARIPGRSADVHATLLAALGIDPAKELISPAGRPLKLADGQPIGELLD